MAYNHIKVCIGVFFQFIYFLAVLALRCCSRPFSSCVSEGRSHHCGVQASRCGGFSVERRLYVHRLPKLQLLGSRAPTQ